jgi:hypothetical protein
MASIQKSLTKYNRTRDPASATGMIEAHKLTPKIHPLLLSRVDAKQQALTDFRAMVSNYKPK